MNTTATLFFLVLGQADGFATGDDDYGSTLVTIPSHYNSLIECEAAGEAARANNQGLSFLSYTCVPATVSVEPTRIRPSVNYFTPAGISLSAVAIVKPAHNPGVKCDEVCELIEAAE